MNETSAARTALLRWYRPRRRAFPWRSARPDPYRILVSEVMLQQTQVARVVPAFRAFVTRFPTIVELAAARRSDVLRAWGGLGYNRRAANLSRSARSIVRDHGGQVPDGPEALAALPGVGPYTAAAVASVAFGVPVPAIDTNARRVTARFRLGRDPHESNPRSIHDAAVAWIDPADPGPWNQAVMDLGRDVCRPIPRCDVCPLAVWCVYRARGRDPERVPNRSEPFAGSTRQVRGAVIARLRRSPSSLAVLAEATGAGSGRTLEAVRSLAEEGLVHAGPAALAGSPRGRVRLAD